MINRKQILDNAKRLIHRKPHLQDPSIMHPERDWSIGLTVAVVIFIITAAWSAQGFLKNRSVTSAAPTDSKPETTVYRESVVKEAINKFSVREAELQNLLGNATPVPKLIEENEATTTDTAGEVVDELEVQSATSTEE